MNPPPGFATEKDVITILNREKRLCELIDGVLVEKTIGFIESILGRRLGCSLDGFVDEAEWA